MIRSLYLPIYLPMFVLLFTFSLLPCPSHAKFKKTEPPPPALTIRAGAQISIEQYDEPTDTFLLAIVKEPGVGPNYTTPRNLKIAIDFPGDFNDFMKKKTQLIGSIHNLRKELVLISEEAMAEKRKRAKP